MNYRIKQSLFFIPIKEEEKNVSFLMKKILGKKSYIQTKQKINSQKLLFLFFIFFKESSVM